MLYALQFFSRLLLHFCKLKSTSATEYYKQNFERVINTHQNSCSDSWTVHKNICLQSKVCNACALNFKTKMLLFFNFDRSCFDMVCVRNSESGFSCIGIVYTRSCCVRFNCLVAFFLFVCYIRANIYIFFFVTNWARILCHNIFIFRML